MQFCRFRCRFNRGGYGPSAHASGPPYRLTIELVIAETKRSPAPSALFFVSFCCSDNTDKTALPRAALCVAWISRRKRRLLSVSTFSSPASYKTLFSMCFSNFRLFLPAFFRWINPFALFDARSRNFCSASSHLRSEDAMNMRDFEWRACVLTGISAATRYRFWILFAVIIFCLDSVMVNMFFKISLGFHSQLFSLIGYFRCFLKHLFSYLRRCLYFKRLAIFRSAGGNRRLSPVTAAQALPYNDAGETLFRDKSGCAYAYRLVYSSWRDLFSFVIAKTSPFV